MSISEAEIIEAAKLCDRERILQLIHAKRNLNVTDEDNRTALMWAAIHGYIDIVEDLIKAGVNVNIRSYSGKTALDYAIGGDKKYAGPGGSPFLAIIRMLEEAGAKKGMPADIRTQQAIEQRKLTRRLLYIIGIIAGLLIGVICCYKGYQMFLGNNMPAALILIIIGIGALGVALKSWHGVQHSDPDEN